MTGKRFAFQAENTCPNKAKDLTFIWLDLGKKALLKDTTLYVFKSAEEGVTYSMCKCSMHQSMAKAFMH